MRLSSKSPSANSSTASLTGGLPASNTTSPPHPHTLTKTNWAVAVDQADICTPQHSPHSTALCQLLYWTKPGRKALFVQGAVLPSAQLTARLLQHYRQGKHRQWQQAGWKQDNRFIWQCGFLNEQQPPEEPHPDVPKPSALTKALNEQRGTC